ncbi:succinate dehydrogenase assembly factor 2 [Litorisediminicola beolgyonensis]|uniref:FAD assembly factor SdhE n=1 Tax=Litorisediminicola beolgyonensis TaxID=1173614 RepID=A0ABW3ZN18_9RHOB
MRSMRRGTKEMDLILMRFASLRLAAMDTDALDRYDALLTENDQDLYQWITGQAEAPPDHARMIAEIADATEK